MKKILLPFLTILIIFGISGCLNIEKKEYNITLKTGTSGSAKIRYINITSKMDNDNKDVSLKDFGELINDYLEGTKINDDFPTVNNLRKKMYIENEQLIAEITFDFDSLSQVKLFKYDKDSPIMGFITSGSNTAEEYAESNGEWGGDKAPCIFWNKNVKNLKWTTIAGKDTTGLVSMNDQFRDWEKRKK